MDDPGEGCVESDDWNRVSELRGEIGLELYDVDRDIDSPGEQGVPAGRSKRHLFRFAATLESNITYIALRGKLIRV